MAAVKEMAATVGVAMACDALGVSRAAFYRRKRPRLIRVRKRFRPAWALSLQEEAAVLEVLHSPRFVDRAPEEICATLLDEGRYLCSPSTMYRLLRKHGEVRERRNQLRHPAYRKPELVAKAPNQVWSWDITKLKLAGPLRYVCLYVILDLFSRYVVGWTVAPRESAALAKRLIDDSCRKQGIEPGQLTLHADRGSAMTSKAVAELLEKLGIRRSHSRPHVSDDNPYSEAQFRTVKYSPGFPDRFGGPEDARAHCRELFSWYNNEHRHSGIAMLTPAAVHFGRAQEMLDRRHKVLLAASRAHPGRFTKPIVTRTAPEAAWINRPAEGAKEVK